MLLHKWILTCHLSAAFIVWLHARIVFLNVPCPKFDWLVLVCQFVLIFWSCVLLLFLVQRIGWLCFMFSFGILMSNVLQLMFEANILVYIFDWLFRRSSVNKSLGGSILVYLVFFVTFYSFWWSEGERWSDHYWQDSWGSSFFVEKQ